MPRSSYKRYARARARVCVPLAWCGHRLMLALCSNPPPRVAALAACVSQGHAREVYAVAFHPDGSLAASGDLGGGMRVWDLRSGKSVIAVQAHAKQLLGLDFAADGHRLASSSDDNTVAIWELRQQRRAYTLPAHSGLIPKVKFSPATAEALVTCSYDGTVRVWSGRDYALLTTLRGHDGRVAAVDVSPDERRIYTISFDRTVKAWGVDGGAMSALSRS